MYAWVNMPRGFLGRSRGWGELCFVVEMVMGWMIWMISIPLLFSMIWPRRSR
jgi:hypothetical protein